MVSFGEIFQVEDLSNRLFPKLTDISSGVRYPSQQGLSYTEISYCLLNLLKRGQE